MIKYTKDIRGFDMIDSDKEKNIQSDYLTIGIVISLYVLSNYVICIVFRGNMLIGGIMHGLVSAFFFLLLIKWLDKKNKYDSLTGLYSFMGFVKAMQNHTCKKSFTSIVTIDLFSFRNVNFTYGYDNGDKILIEVASRIRSIINRSEFAARSFGDKYYILLDRDQESVVKTIQKLSQVLNQPYIIDGKKVHVKVRIAYTDCSEDSIESLDLIHEANLAMSDFKESDNFHIKKYSKWMQDRKREEFEITEGLYRAVDEKEFYVHFQPIIRISDEKVVGLEALVRWTDPAKGIIPPNRFIGIAEELELISEIGNVVQQKVIEVKKAWNEQNHKYKDIDIFINISPIELREDNIIEKLNSIDSNLKGQIGFEITEDFFIESSDIWRNSLKMVKNMGFHISLDDFGTRYSSLEYFKDLPIDILKIDRAFIADVSNKKNISIVEFVIKMCHSQNIKVVAEGVETKEAHDFLKKLNCDFAQGYYYYRPMPIEEIEKILA
jgi:diguanylate cyclase (GGDEF)-like protein